MWAKTSRGLSEIDEARRRPPMRVFKTLALARLILRYL